MGKFEKSKNLKLSKIFKAFESLIPLKFEALKVSSFQILMF